MFMRVFYDRCTAMRANQHHCERDEAVQGEGEKTCSAQRTSRKLNGVFRMRELRACVCVRIE